MGSESRAADPIIEFRNVHYEVNGGRSLVRDLSFRISRGELLVLLGRSGSGKTTTLRLINGLLYPTTGEVLVNGSTTKSWDAIRLRRHTTAQTRPSGIQKSGNRGPCPVLDAGRAQFYRLTEIQVNASNHAKGVHSG